MPPGTQPNSVISVPNCGFPVTINSDKKGNMNVRAIIEIPANIDQEEANLLKEFEKKRRERLAAAKKE